MVQPPAFWLWLLHACLFASGVGMRPVHCQIALLWYWLNPLFCEQARLCIRLEPFEGEFSSFFPSLAIPQFGLLSHVSSLTLSSGHSGQVLTLSTYYATRASLSSPHLLVSDTSVWATSLLAVVVRCIFCEFSFLFFFLPVMLPSEIPKPLTD